jgi:CBS domain-containing protein
MVMTGMVRVPETITLGTAARLMEAHSVAALLVVDDLDEPIGVLTDRHLLAAVAASRHPDHGTARLYMAPVLVDSDGAPRLPDTDAATMVGIALRRAA